MAINDDIILLKKYVENSGEKQVLEKNNLTFYGSGNNIFPWTNEILLSSYEKELDGKKVLSVTSSGDHILHAALGGSKEITGFDINRFCKYYSALKVAMIKTYSYSDFIYMARKFSRDLFAQYLPTIISDVEKLLEKQEKSFWEAYIKLFAEKEEDYLFYSGWNFERLFFLNAYFDEKLYLNLKDNLNGCNIRYVDCSIDKLPSSLNEKYDVIYLSNILSRIVEDGYEQKISLIDKLYTLLQPDGKILDYIFEPIVVGDWHDENPITKNTNFYLDSKEVEAMGWRDVVYTFKKKESDINA